MNTALELLEKEPRERLHHNLEYIASNSHRDFVADALKPQGRSIKCTVTFLYSEEKNYDAMKVREIADFVGGFEGIEKINEIDIDKIDFHKVKASQERFEKEWKSISKYGFGEALICLMAGADSGLVIYNLLSDYIGNDPNGVISMFAGSAGFGIALGLTFPLSKLFPLKKVSDEEKMPRLLFDSLCYKASQADKYIQLYALMEEKGFEAKR